MRLAAGLTTLGLLLVELALVPAEEARAAGCQDREVNACIAADTLWSHAGPQRFVGVGSAETVAAGQLGFGLVTSWTSHSVVFHLPSPAPSGSDSVAVNNQVTANFLFAYGVSDRLELDLALPFVLAQDGAGLDALSGSTSAPHATAFGDIRFGAAYALVPRRRHDVADTAHPPSTFGLVARFETSAPTGQDERFVGAPYATFVPSLSADYRRGRWSGGAELGARIRRASDIGTTVLGTQLYLAAGAAFDALRSHEDLPRNLLTVSAEIRALPVLTGQDESVPTATGIAYTSGGGAIVPAEWTLAARSAPVKGSDFAFQLGFGGALTTGDPITTPRFRFTLGVVFAPMKNDGDDDGVPDSDDHCPTRPGTAQDQGCPAT